MAKLLKTANPPEFDSSTLGSHEDIPSVPRTKIQEMGLRLEELLSLRDGWLDGKGYAPPVLGLRWLALTFDKYYQNDKFIPYFYPTEEGDIQVEWTIERREITLEVDLKNHQAYWHELDLENHSTVDRDLNMDSAEDWQWILDRIKAIE